MKDFNFATDYCYSDLVHKVRTKTKYRRFDGEEPVLIWPCFSHFVTHSTDFVR